MIINKVIKNNVLSTHDENNREIDNVQVIIGTKVQFVADEFKKLCK